MRLWLAMVACFAAHVSAAVLDPVPLSIEVNTVARGEFVVALTGDGRILLPVAVMRELELRIPFTPVRQDGTDYVVLSGLAPWVTHRLDVATATLSLTVDPAALPTTVVQQDVSRPGPFLGVDSAYLNYALHYDRADNRGGITEVPWEAVVNAHGLALESRFLYHNSEQRSALSRLTTRVTKDDPTTLRRWVLGDYAAYGGDLGGGGLFGGISLSKRYSLAPHFLKFPGAAVSGLLETPSEVLLYVNDVLVQRHHLPPGGFQLTDIALMQGASDARLVVRDAFGREQVSEFPLYLSGRLLKRGLHEYDYSVGARRRASAVGGNAYTGWGLLASHRYGFSRRLTAGFSLEAADGLVNGGPSVTLVLGSWGEMGLRASFSQADDQGGHGLSGHYLFRARGFHGRLTLRQLSRRYANLSLDPQDDRLMYQGIAGMGTHHRLLGSFAAQFVQRSYRDGGRRDSVGLSYSRRLARRLSLSLRGDWALRETGEVAAGHEVLASLHWIMGGRRSASVRSSTAGDQRQYSAYLQQSPPLGEGLGYRLRWSQQPLTQGEGLESGEAYAAYNARRATYSIDYTDINGQAYSRSSVAGSLAFIDDRWFLSRPIRDSFALVQVGDVDDVEIHYSNEPVGRTRDGELLVPTLTAYNRNQLSLQARDLPIDVRLGRLRQAVAPRYRAGTVVDFQASRLRAVSGRITGPDGRRLLEYLPLRISGGSVDEETLIGKGGLFYVENLPPGRYQGEAGHGAERCRFELEVPRSEEVVVELGRVACHG